jgi:cell filamentation protein
VLKNTPGLRTQEELDAFEAASTMQRADEPLPAGRLSLSHYQVIHRHLFQDVYSWAGKFRTVRMSKDQSAFCYPEYVAQEMKSLFAGLAAKLFLRNLTLPAFAHDSAEFLATLNAIHPFREGNGRTQTLFLALLANHAGHPLDLDKLSPEPFLAAMVRSFRGEVKPLQEQIEFLAG